MRIKGVSNASSMHIKGMHMCIKGMHVGTEVCGGCQGVCVAGKGLGEDIHMSHEGNVKVEAVNEGKIAVDGSYLPNRHTAQMWALWRWAKARAWVWAWVW
jgi:hypothetical protein